MGIFSCITHCRLRLRWFRDGSSRPCGKTALLQEKKKTVGRRSYLKAEEITCERPARSRVVAVREFRSVQACAIPQLKLKAVRGRMSTFESPAEDLFVCTFSFSSLLPSPTRCFGTLWVSEELWAALTIEVLRADEGEARGVVRSTAGTQERRNGRSLRKPSRPMASSGVIPKRENPRGDPAGNRTRFALAGGESSLTTTSLYRPAHKNLTVSSNQLLQEMFKHATSGVSAIHRTHVNRALCLPKLYLRGLQRKAGYTRTSFVNVLKSNKNGSSKPLANKFASHTIHVDLNKKDVHLLVQECEPCVTGLSFLRLTKPAPPFYAANADFTLVRSCRQSQHHTYRKLYHSPECSMTNNRPLHHCLWRILSCPPLFSPPTPPPLLRAWYVICGDEPASSYLEAQVLHASPTLFVFSSPASSGRRAPSRCRRSRATPAQVALQSPGANALGSPLVDDRPIMNAVKYTVVSGVVWTNRTIIAFEVDVAKSSSSPQMGLKFQASWRHIAHCCSNIFKVEFQHFIAGTRQIALLFAPLRRSLLCGARGSTGDSASLLAVVLLILLRALAVESACRNADVEISSFKAASRESATVAHWVENPIVGPKETQWVKNPIVGPQKLSGYRTQ
ncbi:hypothetical protein PR048_028830 [Dryococelus australis]|uniref:Uncharacterized protein n=1 Tax=Dryococelus australis TaxID=614101 RepID=A0ABQ9GFG3_9NEOP|nr:hypothetical protein PR048_028830 [Dryococelus australis]